MSELGIDDFSDYFTALWGEDRPPFSWQRTLAELVGSDPASWPEAIALPTAAGKTACIDIAVFSLALQASRLGRGEAITAPLRIFFVVDRRVIVDEAFERARCLATRLQFAQDGILKTVADALRRIAHGGGGDDMGDETPLAVFALRGGMYRSEDWARSPLQPTIVASTVDQLGSRLLFRAYGRGPGMWPVYAGLTANDSLVLLDEAHCAKPFLQTLQSIAHYRQWAEKPIGRGFQAVVMSATPPQNLTRFDDQSPECRDPSHPLGRRQMASKPATLDLVDKATGSRASAVLAARMAQEAQALVSEQHLAIVVFVNRVATARAVKAQLVHDRLKHGGEVVLLTGRMRPVDKDDTVLNQLDMLSAGKAEKRDLQQPMFVVATQTLEVGADLDFDAMVTECASLDALRQRFGRLNRMGRTVAAQARILIRADQCKPGDEDPVYGSALSETWRWLQQVRTSPGDEAVGVVDFGIAQLAAILPGNDELALLNAPGPDAPVMLPAHVDCWAQTAPVPVPDPDVSLFLRGPVQGSADVQVCWRADLDLTDEKGQKMALESLTACPPSSSESLSVPISVFKRWLQGSDEQDQTADIEGSHGDVADEIEVSPQSRGPVVLWQGRDTTLTDGIVSRPGQVKPAGVVVIPTRQGGLGILGDLPESSVSRPDELDVGDRAYLLSRARAVLRLHPRLVALWPESSDAREMAMALLNAPDSSLQQRFDEEPDEIVNLVLDLLEAVVTDQALSGPDWQWLSETAALLLTEARSSSRARVRNLVRMSGEDGLVILGRLLDPQRAQLVNVFSDESDVDSSGTSDKKGRPVKLMDHLPGVASFARHFAEGAGLSAELVDVMERAGLLHDLGKADPRFQALLRGGNRLAVSTAAETLLAKSGDMRQSRSAAHRAREKSAYPEGARHELLSVRLAESVPALMPEDEAMRELLLHLIASHHGHCRPFAPVVADEKPEAIDLCFQSGEARHQALSGYKFGWAGATQLERLDSGVAERYWSLVRRYGWWGLAWLEALLRLADHRRSEWEESHEYE